MGQQGKPSTLTEMKTLAHSINSCHWERLHEKSHSDAKTSKSDGKSTSTSKPNQKSDTSQTIPRLRTSLVLLLATPVTTPPTTNLQSHRLPPVPLPKN